MAVSAIKYDSDLELKVQTGTDPDTGEPVIKLRRYSRVKPGAGHEAVYTVGRVIAGLQVYQLVEITRQDDQHFHQPGRGPGGEGGGPRGAAGLYLV
ncbi:DUF1659 domain-containing protein [Desulfallas sp. Bu1-1]|uniref:DUF1659 domain-containing protein n=1 Tax=Desulfallas sp. Bu1-1 TaxID=2787620 RepID=UPI00189D8495|nr:DUF1659 domain-containing protein [Desulfallas sp. Bu1-1]MBF7083938.1 DUF1659 domain-containing protein [Desulfallas sp. Bu1-1]